MPKTLGAAGLRDKTLAAIAVANGEPVAAGDIQVSVYGDTQDADEHRRRQQRLRHALLALLDSKHIVKGQRGFYLLNVGRPAPAVHDLPVARRKYTRRNGTANGVTNGANGLSNSDVRAYIIRDIRAKLSELEALV